MKKIAICSGKGGVGKSMLASALAMLFAEAGRKIAAVDCDVDAPNLAIWLGEPEGWQKIRKISVSEKPVIDNSKLSEKEAEKCVKKCRFNALNLEKGKLRFNPFLCEGCGACEVFCPEGTIKIKAVKNGEIRLKQSRHRFPLVSGQLFPGETGSGKVVAEIKRFASELRAMTDKKALMIIDSGPGTGCPVVASLQDADFVILITEPTPSGFADLKRVLEVVNHFNIPYVLVINKWDINKNLSRKIEKWSGSKLLGKVSYDKKIFEAIAGLKPILETNLRAKKEIREIFKNLPEAINYGQTNKTKEGHL